VNTCYEIKADLHMRGKYDRHETVVVTTSSTMMDERIAIKLFTGLYPHHVPHNVTFQAITSGKQRH